MSNKTVDGVIIQINEWVSKKGRFVKLDSTDQDFFKFGGFHCNVDDAVTIEYKPGSGNYADKFEIVKVTKLGGLSGPNGFKTADKLPKPEPSKNINLYNPKDKDAAIVRAVAFKGAIEIIAAATEQGEVVLYEQTVTRVSELAKLFEPYLKGEK